MKTQAEQMEFATKLQELTEQYGDLLEKLQTASDKSVVLEKMQATLREMTALRESYMIDSL